jgi:hypothetical protein
MGGAGGTQREEAGRLPAGEAPDDIEGLYARLAPLPAPRSFVADVMLAVQAARPATVARLGAREAAWGLAAVVAMVAAGLLAFVAGQALVSGGTLDLLAAVAADAGVFFTAPGVTLLALLEAFPWIETLALLGTLLFVAFCAHRLGRSLATTLALPGDGPAARAAPGG